MHRLAWPTSTRVLPDNVDPIFVRVVYAIDYLVLQPLSRVRRFGLQRRNSINYIDCQVVPIYLIENGKLQRSIDIPFLLVSTNMNVVMVCAAIY